MNKQELLETFEILTPLNANHGVFLVQNHEHQLFVEKILTVYHKDVYTFLQNHPMDNIPQIYQIVDDNDKLIIIEEYIAAKNLQQLIDDNKFDQSIIDDVIIQLCQILSVLHNNNIVHRDIKPSNILLTKENKVYLIDFNAAKYQVNMNSDTTMIGTLGYASPEQFGFGSATIQSDLYSLGVLINVLLTGEFPNKKLCDEPYRHIVLHCIEINHKDRYQSVQEIHNAIRPCIEGILKSYTPVGFRTGKLWKKVISIIVTIFALYINCSVQSDGGDYVGWAYRIIMNFTYFFGVALLFNYQNIQKKFGYNRLSPIMRAIISLLIISGIFMLLLLTSNSLANLLEKIVNFIN